MFDAKTYNNRRKQLIEKMDSGVLLMLGNEESPMNYTDNVYPFRQDSNFLYFFGVDRPGLVGLIDVDEGKSALFGADLSLDHIVWMGSQPTIAEEGAKCGVDATGSLGSMASFIEKARQQGRTIHFLPPYRAENKIKLSALLGKTLNEIENGTSVEFIKAVVNIASRKEDQEISEIEKAVNISRQMHVSTMMAAKAGMKEAELAGIAEGIAVSPGGHLAYPIILTINGQTLHNHYHGNTLENGQLVLGDFGAETAMHYAGDITRTYPVDKTFTNQQKEIYQIVLKALNESINSLKPGILYKDVHLNAANIIASGLKGLGLMKGDTAEAVEAGAHALFFPHGLGHMLGLDVHDMEDLGEDFVGYTDELKRSNQFGLRSLRLARALEPGFVLTVEPGCYFIPELIDRWQAEGKFTDFINYDKLEAYRNFSGIRIEDNVLITENGQRILGEPIPKTIEEIEQIRSGLRS